LPRLAGQKRIDGRKRTTAAYAPGSLSGNAALNASRKKQLPINARKEKSRKTPSRLWGSIA
jgi:hypothetical protein